MPRVSICIPTYNGARFIAEALESALSQTHTELEILVVDDASSDDTINIAEEYARRDHRVQVHRNPQNLGLPKNWDRCRQLASGEWITFLFHDDLLRPDCVEKMVAAGSLRSVPIVCCRRAVTFFSEVPQETRDRFLSYVETHAFAHYFPARAFVTATEFSTQLSLTPLANFVGEPTAVLLHRDTLTQYGPFHAAMRQLVDFEYWARIAVHTGIAYVDEPLITFRVHASSATETNRQNLVRKDRLDSIVLFHDYLHAPAYRPLRRSPIIRLRLLQHYNRRVAQLKRNQASRDPADPSWSDALAHYPPLGHPGLASRLLRWITRQPRNPVKPASSTDASSQGVR